MTREILQNNQGINLRKSITVVNIYVLNTRGPQYIGQMLTVIKWGMDSNIIIVGDINTALTPMDRLSRQKSKKETQGLNDTLDQIYLTDIYRIIHSEAA